MSKQTGASAAELVREAVHDMRCEADPVDDDFMLALADWLEAELTSLGGTDAGLRRRHGSKSPMLRLVRIYLGPGAA